MTEHSKAIIGYSGFDLFEECYGYAENACYIADTEAAAREFMEVASFGGEYRIEPVTLSRIMDDFGCSFGEFAMEAMAFARFRAVASEASIEYHTDAVDGCPALTLVQIEGVKRHPRLLVLNLIRGPVIGPYILQVRAHRLVRGPPPYHFLAQHILAPTRQNGRGWART